MQQYQNEQALAKLRQQQKQQGINPMSALNKVNNLSKGINKVGTTATNLGNRLAQSSNPNLSGLGTKLSNAGTKISDFSGQNQLSGIKSALSNKLASLGTSSAGTGAVGNAIGSAAPSATSAVGSTLGAGATGAGALGSAGTSALGSSLGSSALGSSLAGATSAGAGAAGAGAAGATSALSGATAAATSAGAGAGAAGAAGGAAAAGALGAASTVAAPLAAAYAAYKLYETYKKGQEAKAMKASMEEAAKGQELSNNFTQNKQQEIAQQQAQNKQNLVQSIMNQYQNGSQDMSDGSMSSSLDSLGTNLPQAQQTLQNEPAGMVTGGAAPIQNTQVQQPALPNIQVAENGNYSVDGTPYNNKGQEIKQSLMDSLTNKAGSFFDSAKDTIGSGIRDFAAGYKDNSQNGFAAGDLAKTLSGQQPSSITDNSQQDVMNRIMAMKGTDGNTLFTEEQAKNALQGLNGGNQQLADVINYEGINVPKTDEEIALAKQGQFNTPNSGALTGGAAKTQKSWMNRLGEAAGTGARIMANPWTQALIAGGITKATGGDWADAAENAYKYGTTKATSDMYADKMGVPRGVLANRTADDLDAYTNAAYKEGVVQNTKDKFTQQAYDDAVNNIYSLHNAGQLSTKDANVQLQVLAEKYGDKPYAVSTELSGVSDKTRNINSQINDRTVKQSETARHNSVTEGQNAQRISNAKSNSDRNYELSQQKYNDQKRRNTIKDLTNKGFTDEQINEYLQMKGL